MFARYAGAPNRLGYCGPADPAAMDSADRIRAAAPHFSGAWPYLRVLSRLTGIADPLDHRLVESYWLGGGVGETIDPLTFTAELLATIGSGAQWSHLTEDLAAEAAANHCFHVLGVYPWTRLPVTGHDDHPLHVLDSCRITSATVTACDSAGFEVRCRRLTRTGTTLTRTEPVTTRVTADERTPPEIAPGDLVALHWGRVCDRLTAEQHEALENSTARQLTLTNRRLVRARR